MFHRPLIIANLPDSFILLLMLGTLAGIGPQQTLNMVLNGAK